MFTLIFRKGMLPVVTLLLFVGSVLAQAAPYAYVANSNDNTVSVINTATDATVGGPIPVGQNPEGVTVSPNGSRVYVVNWCTGTPSNCTGNGTVSVINTATNAVFATVPVGHNATGAAVSPDGSRVYVTNYSDNTVSVIDTATNSVVATIPVGSLPFGIAVSPDGRRIYIANHVSNGTISVIDTATDDVVATVPVGSQPDDVVVSPDGSRVYVSNYCETTSCNNGSVSVIDTATNNVVATIPVGLYPYSLAVTPDGSRIYVAINQNNGIVPVIDASTNTVVATVSVGSYPSGVAMSPDGSQIYVTNMSDNTVSVLDASTNTVVATIPVGANPNTIGAFVGPGDLIATNNSATGGAGSQISGTVPMLSNSTACPTTDSTVQAPAQGSVSLSASTGAFTYTPTSATYSGPDAFTWRGQAPGCTAAAAPSTAVSNTATVSLTIDPLLTGLANVTVGEGAGAGAHESFSLTGSTPFTHTLASDNATVLPPAGVTVSPAACGTAGNLNCTLGLTAASAPGTAAVTVTTTDTYGDPVKKTVLVTVVSPPTETGLSNVSLATGQSGRESFTDTGTGALTVTATSSNTRLLPNSGITGQSLCTAAGGCTVTLQPASGQSGTATVTVTVTDAYGQSATGSFDVAVQASSTGGGGGSTGSSGGGGAMSPLDLLMLLGLLGFVGLRRYSLRHRN